MGAVQGAARAAELRAEPEKPAEPLVQVIDDGSGVVRVRLNRPHKLNAFLEPMREDLGNVFTALAHREDARVCVLTGAGRAFCAGGDIKVMRGLIESGDAEQVQRFLDLGARVVTAIRRLPLPVIAAVNGPAAGAGMNLALACDYRIASERASFGQTFVNIGLHTDWGGAYFLTRLVGTAKALELLWGGRMIGAAEALELGIVDRVVPHEQFEQEVEAFAAKLAARPKHVLALTKQSVYEADLGLEHALRREKEAQAECLADPISSARMLAFLDKRKRR